MTVQDAQTIVSNLQAKLGELEQRKLMLSAERDAISFECHVEGDKQARQRLDEIIRETIGIDAELASLTAAIRTGERKVDEAKRADLREIERGKAEKALSLRKDLADAAKIADRALAQGFAALTAMLGTVRQLNAVGAGPNAQLVEANLRRVVVAASMGSPCALGHLAPGDRHSAAELATRWGEGITAFASERSGDAEERAA